MSENNRMAYLDYIRVIATFAVVMIHITSQNFDMVEVGSYDFRSFNLYNGMVRWGLPIFAMISGALFIPREIPVKKLYSKYILRMVTAFAFWSIVYACFDEGSPYERLCNVITGHYHMWFVPMIVGIYMCLPLIKPFAEKINLAKYYLLIAFIFVYIIPELNMLAHNFCGDKISGMFTSLNSLTTNMNLHLLKGYVFYFVLGYVISVTDFSKIQRIIIYVLCVLGFVSTILLNYYDSVSNGMANAGYMMPFTVNVVFECVGIFVFFKYLKLDNQKLNAFVRTLSVYTFGAYLVHVLILEQLYIRTGLNTLSFNSMKSCPLLGLLVFVISMVISAVINNIPVVKKYIV